jgi:hypothetical protein
VTHVIVQMGGNDVFNNPAREGGSRWTILRSEVWRGILQTVLQIERSCLVRLVFTDDPHPQSELPSHDESGH